MDQAVIVEGILRLESMYVNYIQGMLFHDYFQNKRNVLILFTIMNSLFDLKNCAPSNRFNSTDSDAQTPTSAPVINKVSTHQCQTLKMLLQLQ